MKKFVVLGLVLAISAVSSAGLSLMADNSPMFGVDDDAGSGAVAVLLGVSSSIPMADVAITINGVNPAFTVNQYQAEFNMGDFGLPELGVMNVWLIGWGDTASYAKGIRAQVGAPVPGWGDTDMGLGMAALINSDTLAVMDTVFVVPEPMSLVLLGLGGLFLRRRK